MSGGYTSGEVCEIAGASIRELDSWTREDLIHPSVQKADGPGSVRLWSELNLLHVMTIKSLRSIGIKKSVIKKLLPGRMKFREGVVTVTVDGSALRKKILQRRLNLVTRRRGRPKNGTTTS